MADIGSSPAHKVDAAFRDRQSSDMRARERLPKSKAAAQAATAVPLIDPLDSDQDEQHKLDEHA